jgi:hypothetical protein
MLGISVTVYHFLLDFYDFFVLRVSTTFLWGCPAHTVLYNLFLASFSKNHVDMGVGTGYFPARALFELAEMQGDDSWDQESESEQDQNEDTDSRNENQGKTVKEGGRRILLWDLNTSCLARAASRIHDVSPQTAIITLQEDLTKTLPRPIHKYKSVSAFNVVHCLPKDTYIQCAALFQNAARSLDADGVFVGSTVMGPGYANSHRDGYDGLWRGFWGLLAWLVLWFYNTVGIFGNWWDGKEDIEKILGQSFEDVEVWVVGRMILFRAFKPRYVM